MSQSFDDPLLPDGFIISFTPGHCGACERPIDSGILCHDCLNMPGFDEDASTLLDMNPGQQGYISQGYIFEANSRYWVYVDAVVITSPYANSVAVHKSENGILRIDCQNINPDALGVFDKNNQRKHVLVISSIQNF